MSPLNQQASKFPQTRPSLISLPYLCPTWDLSNIHIFFIKVQAHQPPNGKEKCEKNRHQT